MWFSVRFKGSSLAMAFYASHISTTTTSVARPEVSLIEVLVASLQIQVLSATSGDPCSFSPAGQFYTKAMEAMDVPGVNRCMLFRLVEVLYVLGALIVSHLQRGASSSTSPILLSDLMRSFVLYLITHPIHHAFRSLRDAPSGALPTVFGLSLCPLDQAPRASTHIHSSRLLYRQCGWQTST